MTRFEIDDTFEVIVRLREHRAANPRHHTDRSAPDYCFKCAMADALTAPVEELGRIVRTLGASV